jgi:hypothetical protein
VWLTPEPLGFCRVNCPFQNRPKGERRRAGQECCKGFDLVRHLLEHNRKAKPFVRTADPVRIIEKIIREQSSDGVRPLALVPAEVLASALELPL